MADQVLINPKLYIAGLDASGDISSCAINYSADAVDDTKANVGGGFRTVKGGFKLANLAFSGIVNESVIAGPVVNSDETLFPKVGSADQPAIVGVDPGLAGNIAYMMRAVIDKLAYGDALGDMFKFDVNLDMSVGGLRRGTVILDPSAPKTVSGNGAGFQLGAVSVTQKVYACLMALGGGISGVVSGTAGPTFTGVLQSSVDNTFGAPTTRLTFAAKTASFQSEWLELAGPITDQWWRLNYTIAGTNPSFPIICAVAIQTP